MHKKNWKNRSKWLIAGMVLLTICSFALLIASIIVAMTERNSDGYSDGWYYNILSEETKRIEISGYRGKEKNLTIPETIEGYTVVAIGDRAFENGTFSTVSIPSSVDVIGSEAFQYCSNLTKVTIPNGVKRIEGWTFHGCRSLTTVVLPNRLTSIGYDAFMSCEKLTNISIPSSVTAIGSSAFHGCSRLKSITIPGGVTEIGSWTFADTAITSITIPNRVTSIGRYAFNDCKSLTSISIPSSVTAIGWGAFSGCSSLIDMTIPFASYWGDGVETSTKKELNSHWGFGTFFGDDEYAGSYAASQKNEGYYKSTGTSGVWTCTFYIPSSLHYVTVLGGEIGYGAFMNCSKLTRVDIARDVTSVGYYAFAGCSAYIYAGAASQPDNWDSKWNPDNCYVAWGH